MVEKKLSLRPPRMALTPKKIRMVDQVKLLDPNAKDGLRERLRRFAKPA